MVDTAALQTELSELQSARHKLLLGQNAEQVQMGGTGGASRRVQFTPAKIEAIDARIREIKSILGIDTDRRRQPIGISH